MISREARHEAQARAIVAENMTLLLSTGDQELEVQKMNIESVGQGKFLRKIKQK